MQTSSQGLTLIKQFEGFRPTPYRCPAGKLTIGYGHVIKAGEVFTNINKQKASDILQSDIKPIETWLRMHMTLSLTQNQWDALVSFIFNIGLGKFRESRVFSNLASQNIKEALRLWGQWVHAGGLKLKGLEDRRKAEIKLFQEN